MRTQLEGAAAADVALNFIQRWNFHNTDLMLNYPRLFPRAVHHKTGCGSCEVQLLRSIGRWSCGVDVEHSILNAYVHYISTAGQLSFLARLAGVNLFQRSSFTLKINTLSVTLLEASSVLVSTVNTKQGGFRIT